MLRMAETPGTSDLQRLIAELRERLRPETASRAAVPPAGEPPASARAVAAVAPGRPMPALAAPRIASSATGGNDRS